MPHQFTCTDEARLEGVWRTYNGRRFCAWRFEPGTGTLQTSRGVAVRSATLPAQTKSLDELKAELPEIALAMAKDFRTNH